MDTPHVEVEIKPQLKTSGSVAKEEDPKPPHELKLSRTPWGSWAWEPISVLCFLFVGYRFHSAFVAFPESQEQVETVATQGQEGPQRPRRSSQERTVQPCLGS